MALIQRYSSRLLKSHLPAVMQKRFSVREDIRKHREPDKFKKFLLSHTQPYFKTVYKSQEETCRFNNPKPERALVPEEQILMEEMLDDIKTKDFVLFLQYNYTVFHEDRVNKNKIIKSGGTFYAHNNKIYTQAFKTLNYGDVSNLFVARNAVVTGINDDLVACLSVIMRVPEMILMAGFIDKHLYNRDQLKQISRAPKLDQSRANLLGTLQEPSIELSRILTQYSPSGETSNQQQ